MCLVQHPTEGLAINANKTQCEWCDAVIEAGKAAFVDRDFAAFNQRHEFYCSESCVQESDKHTGRYRPIAVGDMLESEELAFEADAKETRAKLLVDDFYGLDLPFFDPEQDKCPWSLWVVVAEHPDGGSFLVLPWTADDESSLLKDDPERAMLPIPVELRTEWEQWWLDMKEIDGEGLEGKIYAFAGMGQWRSADELNALRDVRLQKLRTGEAEKARREVSRLATGK